VHLISLFELEPGQVRGLAAAPPVTPGRPRLAVLLDFLPVGAERFALRAAAARSGLELASGADLLPGFPAGVDLLDAARLAGAHADAVILRHPLRGAARAAAAVSRAPVLSAGDGTGEDPLFALADLAALAPRIGGLGGKSVALCGDLRRDRRVHALAGGLLAVGARVLLVPARGADPGEGFLDRLARRTGSHPVRFRAKSMSTLLDMVDSWLITPDLDHQLSLFGDVLATPETERRAVKHQVREVHAIWMAAARNEEGEPGPEAAPEEGVPGRPPDVRAFVSPARPGEGGWSLAESADERTAALAAALLAVTDGKAGSPALPPEAYAAREGLRCRDPHCVACREPERVEPAFRMVRTDPVLLACVYCGARRKARYVGSRVERRYHAVCSGQVRKIRRRNTVFFASREAAEAVGFVASRV